MMDLSPLKPLQVETPYPWSEHDGECIAGRLGSTAFIVVVYQDGQIDASLSNPRGPATDAQCNAFFRKLGCKPICEHDKMKRSRLFTLQAARMVH